MKASVQRVLGNVSVIRVTSAIGDQFEIGGSRRHDEALRIAEWLNEQPTPGSPSALEELLDISRPASETAVFDETCRNPACQCHHGEPEFLPVNDGGDALMREAIAGFEPHKNSEIDT